MSRMQHALALLPSVNTLLLATLVKLLKDVASFEVQFLFLIGIQLLFLQGTNKMGPENLGIVFGPTLLREKEENVFGIASTAQVVQFMILHYEQLFSVHSYRLIATLLTL
jgi:hypothetical protein